jgi:hypothetical protein
MSLGKALETITNTEKFQNPHATPTNSINNKG